MSSLAAVVLLSHSRMIQQWRKWISQVVHFSAMKTTAAMINCLIRWVVINHFSKPKSVFLKLHYYVHCPFSIRISEIQNSELGHSSLVLKQLIALVQLVETMWVKKAGSIALLKGLSNHLYKPWCWKSAQSTFEAAATLKVRVEGQHSQRRILREQVQSPPSVNGG